MLRYSLLFITLLSLPMAAMANDTAPVILLDHGVICDVELNGTTTAPMTATGVLNLVDQSRLIDVTTPQVPAHLGLSFGIRTALAPNATLADMQVVVTHPPMGAKAITRQSWFAPLHTGQDALNLFTFEYDHELVLGTWIFQLTFADQVLIEQAFEVLPKGSVPVVQQTCLAKNLTS